MNKTREWMIRHNWKIDQSGSDIDFLSMAIKVDEDETAELRQRIKRIEELLKRLINDNVNKIDGVEYFPFGNIEKIICEYLEESGYLEKYNFGWKLKE